MKAIIAIFLGLILITSLYEHGVFAVSSKEKNDAEWNSTKKYLSLLYACVNRGSDISACMTKFEDQLLRNEILETYVQIEGGYGEAISKYPYLNHPTYFLEMYPDDPQKSFNSYESYVAKMMPEIIAKTDGYSKMKDFLLQHSHASLRQDVDSSGSYKTGDDCVRKTRIGYDEWMTVSCDGSKVVIEKETIVRNNPIQTKNNLSSSSQNSQFKIENIHNSQTSSSSQVSQCVQLKREYNENLNIYNQKSIEFEKQSHFVSAGGWKKSAVGVELNRDYQNLLKLNSELKSQYSRLISLHC